MRRFLAIVLPELLNELASEQASFPTASSSDASSGGEGPVHLLSELQRSRLQPCAVVLTGSAEPALDLATRLDAVNAAARERGVRPRQTIAEARALVANLKVLVLQRARISAALKQIAEVALGFGSPVSFDEIDTVWVDISGSVQLFGTERQLAAQLGSCVRALGHLVRIATADGPWVARALARHAALDEASLLILPPGEAPRSVATLPILALPVDTETVAWLAQLGLLFIGDLRKLPSASLAARLPNGRQLAPLARSSAALGSCGAAAHGIELGSIFDLIRGNDESVLIPYQPEEAPLEESSWDDPLNDVQPLLFVSKGLADRLASRLEGRGQAVQELLLTIQYDRSVAALQSAATGKEIAASHDVRIELATPLVHAEDIERIIRSRLQREVLAAPAVGLCLRATVVTRAQSWQLGLSSALGLATDVAPEARRIAVLVAELGADVGSDAVGMLVMGDSHLLEKSSWLAPIGFAANSGAPVILGAQRCPNAPVWHTATTSTAHDSSRDDPSIRDPSIRDPSICDPSICEPADAELSFQRLPTRLLPNPMELTSSIAPGELWVLEQRAFIVKDVRFEERLEAIEWWENEPVYRDYYRVWLTTVVRNQRAREGIEVLAYFDRASGKSHVQAVYD